MKDLVLTDRQKLIVSGKICPYCGRRTEYTDSEEVYGKSYGMIYICRPCNAFVGVHKGTNMALGRLANKDLREAKKNAHLYFDKIWKLSILGRSESYKWLSSMLEIPIEYTHIGMFSIETCRKVVEYSKQFLNDQRRLDLDFGVEPKTPYYNI